MTEPGTRTAEDETGNAIAAYNQIRALLEDQQLRGAFALAEREGPRYPRNATLTCQHGRLAELMVSEEPDRAVELSDKARELFGRALALDPRNPDAAAGLVRVLDRAGETAQAKAVLEPFLRQMYVSPMLAAAYAQIGPRIGEAERACKILQRVVDTDGDGASSHVLHELARLLDRLGRYDEAFAAARRGNDAAARTYLSKGFRPGSFKRMVDETIAATPRSAMVAARRARNASDLPVFIVGMGRSGTTLVEQVIAGHPQAHGGGERRAISWAIKALETATGIANPAGFSRWPVDMVEKATAAMMTELAALAPSATRITDKLPQNFVRLGLIQRMTPAARIIYCRRDPRDVLLSAFMQTQKVPLMEPWDLYEASQIYRAHERIMAHWFEVLDLQILPVQYETLVRQPEIEVRRIIAFLELPWDERCLAVHDNRRLVDTSNFAAVRRPINSEAIGRWRHYERHLEPMLRGLRGHPAADPA
ncbi:MAG: sulfotransferase [Alphaproteobacteria bacterium]